MWKFDSLGELTCILIRINTVECVCYTASNICCVAMLLELQYVSYCI